MVQLFGRKVDTVAMAPALMKLPTMIRQRHGKPAKMFLYAVALLDRRMEVITFITCERIMIFSITTLDFFMLTLIPNARHQVTRKSEILFHSF